MIVYKILFISVVSIAAILIKKTTSGEQIPVNYVCTVQYDHQHNIQSHSTHQRALYAKKKKHNLSKGTGMKN
jgi:hypothetical protein